MDKELELEGIKILDFLLDVAQKKGLTSNIMGIVNTDGGLVAASHTRFREIIGTLPLAKACLLFARGMMDGQIIIPSEVTGWLFVHEEHGKRYIVGSLLGLPVLRYNVMNLASGEIGPCDSLTDEILGRVLREAMIHVRQASILALVMAEASDQ